MKTMKMKSVVPIAMWLVALCAAGAMHANAASGEAVLNPAFHPDTLSYTATVPHSVTEVVMDLSAEHPKATVTVNGNAPTTPVQLSVGENTITILVAAEDARYTRAYTVVVTRQAPRSKAADLARLTAESGTGGVWSVLNIGAFNGDTTAYTATVPHAMTHVRLTATVADAAAKLKSGIASDLVAVASGATGAAVAIDEGINELAVEVTADDGTVRTYTVTVTRAAPPSTNADLSRLAAESGKGGAWTALNIGTFDSDTTAYTATVPHATTRARLTATVADGKATVTGGSEIALEVGANTLAVEVTAEDGTTKKTYTVTVTREVRPPSSNADLSGLVAESGTDNAWSALDIGAFSADTTAYAATVPYETKHARLTATVADANATLTVDGATALNVGANALAVEVTAEDGTTTKIYTVTVTRDARTPEDTDLRWLLFQAASNGAGPWTKVPFAFAPETTEYAVTVPYKTTVGRVQATPLYFDGATYRATLRSGFGSDLRPARPGFWSRGYALSVGDDNVFSVEVTDNDGNIKTYKVTVTREERTLSSNANLSGLTAEAGTDGTWSALDIGAFSAGTTDYSVSVPFENTHARLTSTVAHAAATATGGAETELVVGANALTVEVTAEDGTTKTYTVTVTREARVLSSNANLSGLTAEAGEDGSYTALDIGTFSADTTSYSATVLYEITHARLTATAADAAATVSGGGATALNVGANTLTVEVTAEDGTTKTYTVSVTREARILSSNANLSGLTAEAGTNGSYASLNIGTFSAGTTSYSATVLYETTHARLSATVADAAATVSGGGATALNVGANALTVKVTAEDGTTKTYTVSVTREARILSSNANLSGLTAEAGTNGSYVSLNIGSFSASTTSYSATVLYEKTHARLSATAADAAATVSGGGATALNVGTNTLSVKVTAEDGTTKTYTVTVTREARILSSNANLSGLTAEAGTNGNYGSLNIGTFSAGTTSYSATVPHGTTHARLTATVADTAATVSGGGATVLDVGANTLTVEVTAEDGTKKTYTVSVAREAPPKPLTASFGNVPSTHEGKTMFTIDVRFSEALDGGTAPTVASFDVASGTAKAVERVEAGLYRVSVKPRSFRAATVTLAGGQDCSTAGAVCTADGRALENTSTATVGGPVLIRIEGGVAREGKHATLDFPLSLQRAASHEISVDYATTDGTATAGADYEATSGTLTFAPGETSATVSVVILDDEVDEGEEKFELHLSNALGAYLRGIHKKATGKIRNTDAMPAAFLARFGRAATDHVVDALDARFDDASIGSVREMRLGGLMGSAPTAGSGSSYSAFGNAPGERTGVMGRQVPQGSTGYSVGASGTQDDVLRNMLLSSSFRTSVSNEESGQRLTAWGRAAGSIFAGNDGGLAVEGDTTTVMFGADTARNRWLAGVALAHTIGTGSYQGTYGSGDLTGTLTAVHPYARVRATDRLSAWGTLGLGFGELALENAAGGDWRTPTAMRTAAGGLRGVLLRGFGGLELAGRMDARFTRMTSAAVSGSTGILTEAAGDASRLRLLLEGSRPFSVNPRRTLTPSVEIGLRHDSGDAETGMGLEVGGALRYMDSHLGLAIDLAGRQLAAHADGGYEEWGASASVTLDPGASGRGLSLTLSPSWGAQAMGGAERLWSMTDARSLATGGYQTNAGMRLSGDVAYGLDAFDGRGSIAPYLGIASSGFGQDWRAGVRWTVDQVMEFGFEATRAETATSPASHGVLLRFSWRPGTGHASVMRGGVQPPDGMVMLDGAEVSEPAEH